MNNSDQSPEYVHERNEGVDESFQSFTSAVISATFVYESSSFECPSCGKLLQDYIDHEHAEENTKTTLTLQF